MLGLLPLAGSGEVLVDEGQNTAARDSRAHEHVELLVPTDRELQVAGRDALDAEVLGGIACASRSCACEGSEVNGVKRW